ncbi:MAG: ATP-binding cassette domain-containing protein [Fuerstiella sp.]
MIELHQLGIQRGEFCLQGIDLKIPTSAYSSFIGASGTGKTTILECITGLLQPSAGKLLLNGQDCTTMAAADRGIGYVPQDLGLFSWLNVQKNLAFGLNRQKVSADEQRQRTVEVTEALQLADLLKSRVTTLSRGQAQRVALGRVLVMRPKILVLDEPLSSLDAATKNLVTDVLAKFHAKHLCTVLHVTHHEADIDAMCDVRCEIQDGQVICCEK